LPELYAGVRRARRGAADLADARARAAQHRRVRPRRAQRRTQPRGEPAAGGLRPLPALDRNAVAPAGADERNAMTLRMLKMLAALLAGASAVAASAEDADWYRGGWRTDGGEPHVYQFVIRGERVTGYY